jgi:glycosyltransferase involved in cell wall biosynthesis
MNVIEHPRFVVKTVPPCPGYRLNSWLHLRLPMHLLRHRYDLVFYPYNVLPLFHSSRSVMTIHDVKMLKNRQTTLGRHPMDGGQYLPRAIRAADRVIFVSDFTRGETERDIGTLTNAEVIHSGISEFYDRIELTDAAISDLKRRYDIRNRFFMAFGAAAAYKNVDFLVRSFLRIRRQLPGEYQLLLVGCQDMQSAGYLRTVRDANAQDHVVSVGFVPDQDLKALYNCTDCFVYPSLYEGFGFPPLEAMACGAPVLSSNLSSMPEIVGGVCEMADPTNEASFDSATIDFASRLRDLEYRESLTARAYLHARRFTWRRAAEHTLRVFHEAIG